jgi:hypothetical protein
MREIEYLKDQKRQLEEQLDFVHNSHATYDCVKYRQDEIKGQLAQIEEAIDNLESVKRTSKITGIILSIILLSVASLLLWVYIIKIT